MKIHKITRKTNITRNKFLNPNSTDSNSHKFELTQTISKLKAELFKPKAANPQISSTQRQNLISTIFQLKRGLQKCKPTDC